MIPARAPDRGQIGPEVGPSLNSYPPGLVTISWRTKTRPLTSTSLRRSMLGYRHARGEPLAVLIGGSERSSYSTARGLCSVLPPPCLKPASLSFAVHEGNGFVGDDLDAV